MTTSFDLKTVRCQLVSLLESVGLLWRRTKKKFPRWQLIGNQTSWLVYLEKNSLRWLLIDMLQQCRCCSGKDSLWSSRCCHETFWLMSLKRLCVANISTDNNLIICLQKCSLWPSLESIDCVCVVTSTHPATLWLMRWDCSPLPTWVLWAAPRCLELACHCACLNHGLSWWCQWCWVWPLVRKLKEQVLFYFTNFVFPQNVHKQAESVTYTRDIAPKNYST